MKRLMTICLTLVLGAFLVVPVFAQQGFGRGKGKKISPRGMGAGIHLLLRDSKIAEEVGVTEQQKTELRDLMKQHRHDNIDERDRTERAREALNELFEDGDLDERAINKATQDLIRAQGEMTKMRTAHFLGIRSILSADQMSKLREVAEKRRSERRGQRKARGRRFNDEQPPSWE